jgi:hypothetical protein
VRGSEVPNLFDLSLQVLLVLMAPGLSTCPASAPGFGISATYALEFQQAEAAAASSSGSGGDAVTAAYAVQGNVSGGRGP